MEITVASARTFALVVGVERYRIGAGLHGPSSDALRFVEWLRSKEVPAKNIHLFTAPLVADTLSFAEWAKRTGVENKDARTEVICDLLINRLPHWDGELFYFFWSGHGVVNGREDQCLVCPEITDNHARVINIEAMLQMMRLQQWAHFRRQVCLIDACATDYRTYIEGQLSEEQFPQYKGRAPISSPDQYVICAVSPGQNASNDPNEQSGKFSSVLREILARPSYNQLLPDWEQIRCAIKDSYDELLEEGKLSHQLAPRWINVKAWDGSRYKHFPRLPKETEHEARLKNCVWESVWEQFRHLPFPVRELLPHYQKAYTHHGLPPKVSCLEEMIFNLADRPYRKGVPRLLEFAERIAKAYKRDELAAWVEEQVDLMKLSFGDLEELRRCLDEETERYCPPYYLFIDLPSTVAGKISYWLYDAEMKLIYKPRSFEEEEVEDILAREGVRAAIHQILGNAKMLAPYVTELNIELFVSEKMMALDVDQWDDPQDFAARLGENYCIALRWRDRANGTARVPAQKWREVSTKICQFLDRCPEVRWVAKTETSRKFGGELKDHENLPACIGFSFNPLDESEGYIDPLLDRKSVV